MKTIEILNEHNLKRTSCREGILEVMMAKKTALSEEEIREEIAGNYNRTTFYRSFKTLKEHHVIHKIVIDGQPIKYALDNTLTHDNTHAHFYCKECHTVTCMNSVPIQEYQLPNGYFKDETEVIIKGLCPICEKKRR